MNLVTPAGFRDVLTDEAVARERIARDVQACFAERGYLPIETPTLEVMDVMRAGGRVPGSPFKFFDARGDLLAMRPDVTLQVARMCATRFADCAGPLRFRYMQRVFREADGSMQAEAREMTQIGIECIGEAGAQADAEVVELLVEALELAGARDCRLALATVGVLRALLAACGAAASWKEQVLDAYHRSNFVELDRLTGEGAAEAGAPPVFSAAIRALPRIRGGREAIDEVRALVSPLGCEDGLDAFAATFDLLSERGLADRLLVDFSVMSSFDYYTGIVFEAYAPGLGSPLGAGGRYDNMIGSYGESRPAAGFAFFLEQAMAASAAGAPADVEAPPLRIAVPKGSLNADTVAALEAAGLDVAGLANPGRQLIIRNPGVEYVIVRPTDAPAFVASGAADCGICGKDSLLEAERDVVELVDLEYGACRFVVAEPAGAAEATDEHLRRLGSIRVATKYPRITAAHYAKTGMQVEIVKLHGNIELAPLTGMAERIVDITATGTTLRENDLVVVDEVLSSTARFFANTCAFRTDARIVQLARTLARDAQGADAEERK
ncbi:ATP phosphoribosyltransferase regulatory subunit [Arabiibacter massiliensis]|uniref:ATP phosphoribosyltransferase regulatory subunit n=1 Tax=Arabiibacter massiliensis TaxID=1870985 RepID=UPI0009B9B769|nr:ATP phosphoribosyltransferase regulatory subunit [Arabiibacter massiliensis]